MAWNLTADQSAAISAGAAVFAALGTIVTAVLTVGIFRTSRTLAMIEEGRTTADFRLAWSESAPLSVYGPGNRDFMILVTNAGGHASSVENARLSIGEGTTRTVLKVTLRNANGADFTSLNIQPGEQVMMRAAFIVPDGLTLADKKVVLTIKPVLGRSVSLRHDHSAFQASIT